MNLYELVAGTREELERLYMSLNTHAINYKAYNYYKHLKAPIDSTMSMLENPTEAEIHYINKVDTHLLNEKKLNQFIVHLKNNDLRFTARKLSDNWDIMFNPEFLLKITDPEKETYLEILAERPETIDIVKDFLANRILMS